MRTIVYVDGFNLYYGALKGTPYKWLNLHQLCRLLLPQNQLVQIKYFTARVSARPHDPDQPTRQQTYLRALQTLPNLQIIVVVRDILNSWSRGFSRFFAPNYRLKPRLQRDTLQLPSVQHLVDYYTNLQIIYGHFLAHEILMPLANNPARQVKVIKTEEKGSDVNIAAHLVNDGHRGRYDMAVLITNDSDLLEPVKIVCYELNLPVGILNPQQQPSRVLLHHASFIKKIRRGPLQASQFPAQLTDANGVFRQPAGW